MNKICPLFCPCCLVSTSTSILLPSLYLLFLSLGARASTQSVASSPGRFCSASWPFSPDSWFVEKLEKRWVGGWLGDGGCFSQWFWWWGQASQVKQSKLAFQRMERNMCSRYRTKQWKYFCCFPLIIWSSGGADVVEDASMVDLQVKTTMKKISEKFSLL